MFIHAIMSLQPFDAGRIYSNEAAIFLLYGKSCIFPY